ncbi:MAG: hypothetical protein H0U90_05120 [Actinobacteria bacterium]|nr:hypothetical protein [Actinomycetota bacterium]
MVRRLLLLLLLVLGALALTPSAFGATLAGEAEAPRAASCSGPCPIVIFAKGSGGGSLEIVTHYNDGRPPLVDPCTLAPRDQCVVSIDELSWGAVLRPVAGDFKGWEGCPGSTTTCTIGAGTAGAVCVTFGTPDPPASCPPPYLQLFKKGDGKGTVMATSPSHTASCGSSCASEVWTRFAPGETIKLTAIATDGTFSNWELCPQPAGVECDVPLVNVATVCAVFVRTTPPSDRSCPAATVRPPPPPPPPAGPPRLGSRCTISGSAGADVIRGTSQREVICGRGGNDRIYGGGGHDLILGGPGNDKIYGQSGRDHLRGEAGTDLLNGGAADDVVVGGTQADTIYARDGIRDVVNGGTGSDRGRFDRADQRTSVERRF